MIVYLIIFEEGFNKIKN